MRNFSWLAVWVLGFALSASGQIRDLDLELPTANKGLFSGDFPSYYMHTDRSFEGVRSKPWQGGTYGYTRDEKRISSGVIFTRFHEGIDIRPHRRDAAGRSLDEVSAIAEGRVVHVSTVSSRSSYGRYVVVEHDWGYGPFYSLYGHLETISVKPGTAVEPGTVLGIMGCTGWGGNRDVVRSHLHLELNLMLHDEFPRWHDRHHKSPNYHNVYNGMNLAGIDIAGLFKVEKDRPRITIPEFVSRMEPYFKVLAPRNGSDLQLIRRYPWLAEKVNSSDPSWEITLSASGIPLEIATSSKAASKAVVSWVKYSPSYHSYFTRGRLSGSGNNASLSASGAAYVQLLLGSF